MKLSLFKINFLWIPLFFSPMSLAAEDICGIETNPIPVEILAGEESYIWDLRDRPELWRPPAKSDPIIDKFKSWVRREDLLDQTKLLKIQRKIALEAGLKKAVLRHDLLIEKKVGEISAASCLERLLFSIHIRKYGPWTFPAEYMAYILKSKVKPGWLRIYYAYGDGFSFTSRPEWSKAVRKQFYSSPPQNPKLLRMVFDDLSHKEKWEFFALLHSHPFMRNFPEIPHIGGTILPSTSDIEGWLNAVSYFHLKSAWITNGIDTIRIRADQFQKLAETLPRKTSDRLKK